MHIEEFTLERIQSIWENRVDLNLTESGVHPYSLRELLGREEIEALLDLSLGYGWTNGEPELRAAIAALYQRTTAENVLVTNGSAEANFLAMWSLLEPGDEIVVMLPNYMQICGLARSLGVEIRPFRLRQETGWAPDLAEVRGLVNGKTKAVVVCNPNNPTGAVLSRGDMEEIVDIAESAGAMIYADEVYKGVELDGIEGPSFRDLTDRAVVAAGLSKAYALPGLRLGWLAGPEEFIAAAWHRNDYTTITTTRLSESVGAYVLEPERRRRILERNRGMLRHNLDLLLAWIDRRPELFSFVPPKAGGMAFLRYHLDVNSTRFADRLRQEKGVFVLAGDVFGMDGYIRLGIGGTAEELARGLELLGQGLDEERGR